MIQAKKRVYLIGIGTGVYEGMTGKAIQCIKECDVCFGAKRMLSVIASETMTTVVMYRPEAIATWLQKDSEWRTAGVLLSGDVGFYSGAKKLVQALANYDVIMIPGISSLMEFCAKLKLSWDEVSYGSLHGREMNIIGKIHHNRYTFALLDGKKSLEILCDKLQYYHMNEVILHIGMNLSYPDEVILHQRATKVDYSQITSLAVVIIENPSPSLVVFPEIKDEEFIRGDVPMTKSEVRNVIIQKLNLSQDSVLYDIGAGTGSVGIQAACGFVDARIYAVEQKPEAIKLIKANKQKFKTDNLTIIQGRAPDVIKDLPAATHAFIGGSSGNLEEILDRLWQINKNMIVILSMITLETISEIMELLKKRQITNAEIVQITVSKAKKAGNYHLMIGQNPVTIVSIDPNQMEKEN